MPLVTINGVTYNLHETGPRNWGRDGNNFATAVAADNATIKANMASAVADLEGQIAVGGSGEFLRLLDTPSASVADAGTARFRQNGELVQVSVDGERYQTIARTDDRVFNILDYGADPTGVADSSVAIQAAIDAMSVGDFNTAKGTVYAPRGTYLLNSELTIDSIQGFRFLGAGKGITKFIWGGHGLWRASTAYVVGNRVSNAYNVYICTTSGTSASSGGPTGTGSGITDGTAVWAWQRLGVADVLTIRGCQTGEIANFELRGASAVASRPRALIRSTSRHNYALVPYNHSFHDLNLGGGSNRSGVANRAEYGIAFEQEQVGEYGSGTIGPDYNNSEHKLEGVNITDLATAGFFMNQTQCKSVKYTNCDVNTCWRGVQCAQGAFSWFGGNMSCRTGSGDRTGVAFLIGSPNDGINIEACNSEDTGRFLDFGETPGGAPWTTNVRGNRYAMNSLATDGKYIRYPFRGTLVVEGNLFAGGYQAGDVVPVIWITSSTGHVSVDVKNNVLNYYSDTIDSSMQSIISGGGFGVRESGNAMLAQFAGQGFITRRNSGSFGLGAWRVTHAYVAGDRVTNSGNSYYCITAGTSAGSGGPTTTSSDITDGTVHWRYDGAGVLAKWTYETPRHNAAAQQIIPVIVTRTGTSAASVQINSVTQTTAGFTIVFTDTPTGSDSVSVSWMMAQA